MRNPARRPAALAAARGWMLAVSSAVLSVTAHHLAHGDLPDPALTLLLSGLVGWTATAVARKARGPIATVALLGAAQVIMHLVLTTLAGHDMTAPNVAMDQHSGLAMFTAHAIATLLTALLVARADAVLLTVLAVLRAILPRLLTPLPVPAAAPAPVPARTLAPSHLIGVDLRRVHGRRGPPRHS